MGFFSALYRDHTSKETHAKHTHTHTHAQTHANQSADAHVRNRPCNTCGTATHTCKHTQCLHPAESPALCQTALAFRDGSREMSTTTVLVEVKKKQHFLFVFCACCVSPYADFYIWGGKKAATLILDVCFLCVCYIFNVPRRIIAQQIVSCKKQKQ